MSGDTAASFLDEMQALALIALRDWDLDVVDIAPIKVRENAVFRLDLAGGARAVLRVHRCGYHSDAELDSEFGSSPHGDRLQLERRERTKLRTA